MNLIETTDGLWRQPGPGDEEFDRRRNDEWERIAPRRFRGASLNDLPTEVLDNLNAWKADKNVIITGPVGAGKTHLAFALARHRFMADHRLHPVFAPVVELLDNLRPGGRDYQPTEYHEPRSWSDYYASVDLLILDDLGGEKPTDWTAERLYMLINRRWLDDKPSIITTNLGPDQLREQIGERTYDRLRDGALGVRLSGESHRRPA